MASLHRRSGYTRAQFPFQNGLFMIPERPESRWSLTQEALGLLLDALDPDRERAALQYEALRRRVDALFRFWGCAHTADLADRTLDRVAVKLAEGAVVPASSLHAYMRGVARLIFHESVRERELQARTIEDAATLVVAHDDREHALSTLDECLQTLHDDERKLILDYYGAQGGRTIELRKRLASRLDVTLTALRIRAHRLRQRLEACVSARLKRSAVIHHLPDRG
jgi:DNA-directed RNA polymerase specialized sigma24 family protein